MLRVFYFNAFVHGGVLLVLVFYFIQVNRSNIKLLSAEMIDIVPNKEVFLSTIIILSTGFLELSTYIFIRPVFAMSNRHHSISSPSPEYFELGSFNRCMESESLSGSVSFNSLVPIVSDITTD